MDRPEVTSDWPVTVRVSRRARRLQLRVLPGGEAEVVLPQGMSPAVVAPFLARHRDWLAARLAEVEAVRAADPEHHAALPERIRLEAVEQAWTVEYRQAPRAMVRTSGEDVLRVGAPDETAARGALQRWLSRQGQTHLLPWLAQTSQELGLDYRQASIRAQKTRWGSCSARRDINLNRALLFLPADCVRYLFVHELCHTVHLNHSRRFWALVSRHEPRYRLYESALRHGQSRVPAWAYARGG